MRVMRKKAKTGTGYYKDLPRESSNAGPVRVLKLNNDTAGDGLWVSFGSVALTAKPMFR